MRFAQLLQALSLASGVLGVAHVTERDTTEGFVQATKKFIVEVTPGGDVDALSAHLTSQGATVLKTFKSDVFSGLSVQTDSENIDTLQDYFAISKAWPLNQIWLAPLEPSSVFDTDTAAKNYSVHSYTGVDKLHEAGIYGKGATVAIVDTGVDYNHPALGGGFGPGYKIAGGWDFVGQGSWPALGQPKQPDADPMDKHGHGTHVSGIIGGDSEWFKGVAPEATLLMYKVFTENGGTEEDVLIDAFIMAYEANADVITSSVGGVGGFATNAWATIASRIAEKGVLVTISGGNDGKFGPFYGSTGSSGKEVLSIASAEGGALPGTPFKLTYNLAGQTKTDLAAYTYFAYQWDIKDYPIVPFSLDTSEENQACNPLPEGDYPDLSQSIVLVRRGGCDFLAQEYNLRQAYKSNYVMYYNDEDKPIDPWSWLGSWPKALVDKAVGEAIIENIKAEGSVTADFTPYEDPDYRLGMFNSLGNRPNYFTSWAALYDMTLKPDVAGPGGEILSTYLDGSWTVLSGTSMACPYVAGVAALYIGQYGGRSVHGEGFGKLLRNKIVSSGVTMPWSLAGVVEDVSPPVDTGFWAPPIQAGSGMIDAFKVLNYTTELSFEKFHLNDTAHFNRYHKAIITNNAKVPVTYTFKLQPAAGIEAKGKLPTEIAALTELKPIEMVPDVTLPSGTFKVLPGQSKTAQFNFDYPRGLNTSQLPVFGGKILISSSAGEELSIPYFGGAFDIKKEFDTVFKPASVFATALAGTNLSDHTTITFDTTVYGTPTSQDFIKIFASFKWGCSELRWDIFEAGFKERSWTYPPVVGQNGYIGSIAAFREAERFSYVDPDTMDVEDTVPFPWREVSRNSAISYTRHSYFWLGKLADGTYIKPGNYSMRFAALRPFGTPEHSDNWDVFQTPIITVIPKPNGGR